jgi:hypothetical protein
MNDALSLSISVGIIAFGIFRSTPVNGHSQDRRACLKGAKSGLMHHSKQRLYSITSSARVRRQLNSTTIT